MLIEDTPCELTEFVAANVHVINISFGNILVFDLAMCLKPHGLFKFYYRVICKSYIYMSLMVLKDSQQLVMIGYTLHSSILVAEEDESLSVLS